MERLLQGTDPDLSARGYLRLLERYRLTGSWSWDFARDEHRWSSGLFDLLGYAPGSVRPSHAALLGCMHPEDRAALATAPDRLQEGSIRSHTFRVLRPDGTLRILLGHSEARVAPDGRPNGLIGTVLDVTDRQRIEQVRATEASARRRFFTTTGSYFAHIPLVPFQPFPEQLLELTGRRLEDFQENWLCAIPRDEHGYWQGPLTENWTGSAPFTYTYTQILADGERVPYRGTFAPLRNELGETEGWSAYTGPERLHAGPAGGTLARGLERAVAGRHLRAARGLLDWTMADLARASGLSFSTVRRLEENAEAPAARSLHTAVDALRVAGIRFSLLDGGLIALARR